MNSVRISARAALAVLLLAAVPSLAHAHTGASAITGFGHGFTHPLLGLDHLLAMIAVGILAGGRGGRALWALPAAFVTMMVGGFAVGAAGVALPGAELAIAVSVLALGVAIARRAALPVPGAVLMVAVFALFHGHGHGAEMPAGAWSATYALGFAVATLLLHGAGIAVVLGARTAGNARIALERALGGAIAAAGMLLLI